MFQQKLSTKKLFTKFIRKTKRKRVIKSSEKKNNNNKTNKKTPKQTNKQSKTNGRKYFQYLFRDYYEVINRIVKKATNSTDLEKSLKTFKSHPSIRPIKMIKYDNTKFSFYHVQ